MTPIEVARPKGNDYLGFRIRRLGSGYGAQWGRGISITTRQVSGNPGGWSGLNTCAMSPGEELKCYVEFH